MSQPVLLKIYGHLAPARRQLANKLKEIAVEAFPPALEQAISLDGELLNISFEGIYFPLEEVLTTIQAALCGNEEGKLDKLDLESWLLTRYVIANGQIVGHKAPLNNVLAWSGH